jgi:hypothetical protein
MTRSGREACVTEHQASAPGSAAIAGPVPAIFAVRDAGTAGSLQSGNCRRAPTGCATLVADGKQEQRRSKTCATCGWVLAVLSDHAKLRAGVVETHNRVDGSRTAVSVVVSLVVGHIPC